MYRFFHWFALNQGRNSVCCVQSVCIKPFPKHIKLPSIRYMFKPRQLSITGRSKAVLLLLLRVIDDSLELHVSSSFESDDDY